MPQIVPARSLELHEVEARFGLRQVREPSFFPEWQDVDIELDERDRYWLDKAKDNFLSLIKFRLHEEVVKISILAPLLAVSGLGSAPFIPKSEERFPLFGLLTNGRHFMFVKLSKQAQPVYGLSELFTLFKQKNEMYQVATILQQLGRLVMKQDWDIQKVG